LFYLVGHELSSVVDLASGQASIRPPHSRALSFWTRGAESSLRMQASHLADSHAFA
jgi:hypothetical protein